MAEDKELEQALKNGNIITIGPEKKKKIHNISLSPNIFKNLSKPQYNGLIGIDFTKTIAPERYTLCLDILYGTYMISDISNKKRYLLQSFLNELSLGKILELTNDLIKFTKSDKTMMIKLKNLEDNSNILFESMMNVLFYLIVIKNHFFSTLSMENSNNFNDSIVSENKIPAMGYISKNELIDFLENPNKQLLLKKSWRMNKGEISIKKFRFHYFISSVLSNMKIWFKDDPKLIKKLMEIEVFIKDDNWEKIGTALIKHVTNIPEPVVLSSISERNNISKTFLESFLKSKAEKNPSNGKKSKQNDNFVNDILLILFKILVQD